MTKEFEEKEKLLKEAFEEELSIVKKENFMKDSLLKEANLRGRVAAGGKLAAEIASKEDLDKIEKEIKEQESIIQGYQKENERLLQEVKATNKKMKDIENSMFQVFIIVLS